MAIYNYKCPQDHIFEVIQSMGTYTGKYICPDHKTTCLRTYEGQGAPAALGASGSGGYETTYSDYIQLGKKFGSAAEQDRYAEKLGLHAISKNEHDRGDYYRKGDDRVAEWETPSEVRERNKRREAEKQEVYATIRANGGVHLDHDPSKVYQLNEKNQLVRTNESGQTRILEMVPESPEMRTGEEIKPEDIKR